MNLPAPSWKLRASLDRGKERIRAVLALAVLAAGVGLSQAQYRPSTSTSTRPGPIVNLAEGIPIGTFLFSPSVFLSVAHDTNVFKVEDGFDYDGETRIVTDEFGRRTKVNTGPPQHATADILTTASARLALKLPYSHSYSSLTWVPKRTDYRDVEAPLKNSHQIVLDNKLNFSNGSSIQLQHEFASGYFETRRLEDTFVLSAAPYQRHNTELSYDWSFAGVWGLAGKLQRTDYEFDRTTAVQFRDAATGRGDSETGQYDLFNYVNNAAEARGYRNFLRFQVYGGVNVGRTQQDRRNFNQSQLDINRCDEVAPPGSTTPPTPLQLLCEDLRQKIDFEQIDQLGLNGGIKGNILRQTVGDIRVGVSKWEFRDGGNDPFTGLSFAASLDHTFNSHTLAHMRLQRVVNQATGQYTGYYIRQEGMFWLERKLTMQLSVAAGLGANYRGYPAVVSNVRITEEGPRRDPRQLIVETEPFSLVDYFGFLDVRYRPGRAAQNGPLVLVLSCSPNKTVTDLPGLNTSGQRMSLSLQYGWF